MDETTSKDIADLNRRFLYLVKQLASHGHATLLTGLPGVTIERVKKMTLGEIDDLAENMPATCFFMRFNETTFNSLVDHKANRRAYTINIVSAQQGE